MESESRETIWKKKKKRGERTGAITRKFPTGVHGLVKVARLLMAFRIAGMENVQFVNASARTPYVIELRSLMELLISLREQRKKY